MKFKSNLQSNTAIFLSSLMLINSLGGFNPTTVYASYNNSVIISKYKQTINSYLAEDYIDDFAANALYETYESLYLEYIRNNDINNAIETLKQQVPYSNYLGYNISNIYSKINSLTSLPELYVKSQKTSDQLYFGEKLEPLDNKKFIGVFSEEPATMMQTTHNHMATIDVNFNFQRDISYNFKDLFESKYDDLIDNYSSAYINIFLNNNEVQDISMLNQGDYEDYFKENLAYINSLDKNVFVNLYFQNVSGLDPNSFKETYKYFHDMLSIYAPNVSLVYSYVFDEKYQPDENYIDWVGVPINIDNSSNSDIYSLLSKTINAIDSIKSFDKPMFISNLQVTNFTSQYDVTNKLNELYSNCELFFPEVKGVLFNNRTNLLDNNLYNIYTTYCLEEAIYSFGTFIKAEDYSYNSSYNKNSDILEFNAICSDLLDSNNLISQFVTATYTLNNNVVHTSSERPFSYNLNISDLRVGNNSFTVNFTGNNGYNKTLNYNINKSDTDLITISSSNNNSVSNMSFNDILSQININAIAKVENKTAMTVEELYAQMIADNIEKANAIAIANANAIAIANANDNAISNNLEIDVEPTTAIQTTVETTAIQTTVQATTVQTTVQTTTEAPTETTTQAIQVAPVTPEPEPAFVRPSSFKLDVKNVLQNPELPTGCEITALTTVLNYLGYGVSKTTMASDFMDRGPIGTTHPNSAFIGNPETKSSYGCYAPVIVNAANKYLGSIGSSYKAYNLTGTSLHDLTTYVAKGYPVLIWGTMGMIASYKTTRWVINGEEYYWLANEHCLVLTGYDDATGMYTVADPLKGITQYSKSVVEMRYAELGKQSVILSEVSPSSI